MATIDALYEYCRCSANPVGRIVLGLFGHRDAERQERSDDICTALQLTNCWQDIAGDLERRRVYLPQDDLDRFAGSRDGLAARTATPAFRELMRFEVARARALFERGLPLADLVRGRLRREVRLFARGGLAILDRIDAVDGDVFARRPTLRRGDFARLLVRSLFG
jgi:phytoene/squalene synthetase